METLTLAKFQKKHHCRLCFYYTKMKKCLNIEEILSYQVYQYDRAAREVTMATNEPQRSFRQEKIKGNELEGKERSTR